MQPVRRLSRREFVQMAAVALVGTAAGACAQPTATPAPKPTSKPAEATVAPTAKPAAAPTVQPTAVKQSVRLSHWWGDRPNPWFDKFRAGHPNIDLQIEQSPWDGYHDKLVTQVAAGNAPDVAFADSGYYYQMIVNGVFRNVTEQLKGDSTIDPKKWAIDPALDSGYRGAAYGLPQWHPDSPNVFVNKPLFDAAGIKVPDFGTADFMKWDWAKFVEAAKAMTKRKADGTAEQWGVGGIGHTVGGVQRDMVWTNGAEFFDDTNALDAKVAKFTDPAFVEAWQWLVDLEMKHHVATAPEDEQGFGATGAFLSGKVAMTFGWNGYDDHNKANFEWSVIAPPFQKKRTNKYGGNSWFISSSTKQANVAASWTVIAWLTASPEGLKGAADGGYGFCCYDPDTYLNYAKTDLQRKLWATILNRQKAALAENGARPFGLGLHAQEVSDLLNAENDRIFSGKETVEQGLANAKQQVDKVLSS